MPMLPPVRWPYLLALLIAYLVPLASCSRSDERPRPEPRRNTPTAEAARYFIDIGPSWVEARADLSRLGKSDLLPELLPFALQSAPNLQTAGRACVQQVLQHSRDLLLVSTHESGFAVLALDASGPAALRKSCLGTFLSVARIQVRGSDEAYAAGDDVVALAAGNVLLYGSKDKVEAALDPKTKRAALPAHFTLGGDDQVAIRCVLEESSMSFVVKASTTAQRLLASMELTLPSVAEAENLQKSYQASIEQVKTFKDKPGTDPRAVALADAFSVSRQDQKVRVRMELKGPAASQARDVRAIAAISQASREAASAPPP